MKEREFASQFRKHIRIFYGDNVHVVPLIDAPRSGKKPYDTYVLTSSTFSAIEFKLVKGKTLNSDILTERQCNSLFEVRHCGGKGYVIVYLFQYKEVFICDFRKWGIHIKGNSIKIDILKIDPKFIGCFVKKDLLLANADEKIWDMRGVFVE